MSLHIQIHDPFKADVFTTLFQHMKLFTDQVNISFDKDRLFIQSMDVAKVCVFEIRLPSTWFTTYEFDANRSGITIGIQSTILFRILNARDKGQLLDIRLQESDSDKLFVSFTGENKSVFDKNFEMPLLEIDEEGLEIPETPSTAEFTLASTNFANIINQLKMFGDNLDVFCSEEKIHLTSTSADCGKMSVDIQIDDLSSFSINENETLELSFSLGYLHNICMYNKLAKDVEVLLTDNFPMRMVYSFGELASLTFYLAPKQET